MELRHLRYFLAVAETGSLSRAAEKLFIAQPPLSVQIRQLEEEMGVPLFVRHPKGVHLTPAGQALVPEARFLLDRAAQLRDALQDAAPSGSLTLGFVPSASSTVLPDLVRSLRRQHANLNLELREMISDEQVEALAAGHIDAGIARSAPRHPRLLVAQRIVDPFCLAQPRAEARAGPRAETPAGKRRQDRSQGRANGAAGARPVNPAVPLKLFAEHSFVGFTRHRGPAYFDHAIHLCSQAGFSPRIRYEASTVHGVLDLVGAGLGVALVPASALLLNYRDVLFRPLHRSGQLEQLTLLRRKSDSHPLLPLLETSAEAIFASIAGKVAHLIAK